MLQTSYCIRINYNKHDEVELTTCDCPAGAGSAATCKHIAATLLTLMAIRNTGDLGEVNHGCTDKLQSFYRPSKAYEGR